MPGYRCPEEHPDRLGDPASNPSTKSALSISRPWAVLPKKKRNTSQQGYMLLKVKTAKVAASAAVALKQEQSRRIMEREWLNNNNQPWP